MPICLRIGQLPENEAIRRVRCPPPSYRDQEVRLECKRASQPLIRGLCHPQLPLWHIRKEQDTDGHAPNANQFEFSFLERSHLVGSFKAF
jgi:hypothetical protein